MTNKGVKRLLIPGEEWVYFKIYTGIETCEELLIKHLHPLIKFFMKNKIIDKWFFIRYRDPNFHLRIRLHLVNNNFEFVINKLVSVINKLLGQKLIWNYQLNTYKREIERYGMKTIQETEQLFFYDSELAVEIISYIKNTSANIRGFLGLLVVDNYINIYNYTFENKIKFLKFTTIGYEIERYLKIKIDKKFRENKELINDFIKRQNIEEYDNLLITRIVDNQFNNIAKIVINIFTKKDNTIDKNYLINSYIHMSCNRLFKLSTHKNEFVLYQLLLRYYKNQYMFNLKNNSQG